MLGRAAEESQAAGPASEAAQPDLGPSTSQQAGPQELSQKASDAFDAAAAGGLSSMADLKAVTSDIMDRHNQPDGNARSASPHIGSIEHLSPAANLAMLQACARYTAFLISMCEVLLCYLCVRSCCTTCASGVAMLPVCEVLLSAICTTCAPYPALYLLTESIAAAHCPHVCLLLPILLRCQVTHSGYVQPHAHMHSKLPSAAYTGQLSTCSSAVPGMCCHSMSSVS